MQKPLSQNGSYVNYIGKERRKNGRGKERKKKGKGPEEERKEKRKEKDQKRKGKERKGKERKGRREKEGKEGKGREGGKRKGRGKERKIPLNYIFIFNWAIHLDMLSPLIYSFSISQFIWEYKSGKGKSTYIFVFN